MWGVGSSDRSFMVDPLSDTAARQVGPHLTGVSFRKTDVK